MRNMHKFSTTLTKCHDCGARPGEYHRLGCDVERCPRCGFQLLTCLMGGCPESMPGEPWPPPLDDREVWTGEWPGERECREFGWYCRMDPDKGLQPCEANAPGADTDLNRLFAEAEWDRRERRYVRTTLTEALAEMGRRGIVSSRGSPLKRREGVADLAELAKGNLAQGEPVQGYAFYTWEGARRKRQGKDFALHFGQVKHPDLG